MLLSSAKDYGSFRKKSGLRGLLTFSVPRSNWITPIATEGAAGNAYARGRLAAFVFIAIHQRCYAPYHFNVEAGRDDFLGRLIALHITFQDGIEHLVGWQ